MKRPLSGRDGARGERVRLPGLAKVIDPIHPANDDWKKEKIDEDKDVEARRGSAVEAKEPQRREDDDKCPECQISGKSLRPCRLQVDDDAGDPNATFNQQQSNR